MGERESRIAVENENSIQNIYSMFNQSNSVIIHALKQRNPTLTLSRIKNIESVVQQLLSPFKQNSKYLWGEQVYTKFFKYFSQNFEILWMASRQQFYQLLLQNCKVAGQDLQHEYKHCGSYQNCFYKIAGQQLQRGMEDSFTGDNQYHFMRKIHTLTLIGEELNNESASKFHFNQQVLPFTIQQERKQKKQNSNLNVNNRRLRIESSSLIVPQTLFTNRLSLQTVDQFSDLLKFYKQFAISLQQIFFSNNLVSCPIKNFIFCFQERIARKKIKVQKAKERQSQVSYSSEENRRIYKQRQENNNFLLYQIKNFMKAYTEFVWMFFQLHFMEQLNLGKIINSQILYGIIFKNLWTFVDWIFDRGFQFQQAQLQNLIKHEPASHVSIISPENMQNYLALVEQLRDERHPQQYLKKVVIFYRQVSKKCQNTDQLLALFEEVIITAIKQKGCKNLALFRMRNIIQKLLDIQDSSLSGGQIAFSWTNWCVLIEILKKKASFKYSDVVIYKKKEGRKGNGESEIASEATKSNSKEQKLIVQNCIKVE